MITSKLPDLKPLHASWIINIYGHLYFLRNNQEIITHGFNYAEITKAVNKAIPILEKMENPFRES